LQAVDPVASGGKNPPA